MSVLCFYVVLSLVLYFVYFVCLVVEVIISMFQVPRLSLWGIKGLLFYHYEELKDHYSIIMRNKRTIILVLSFVCSSVINQRRVEHLHESTDLLQANLCKQPLNGWNMSIVMTKSLVLGLQSKAQGRCVGVFRQPSLIRA